jgi:hypothetical protein
MKFDFVIGNPPYQGENDANHNRMPPVYHYFMDNAFKIGEVVELITPARFLFNAGFTPKDWNNKMLKDEHFKVLHYEPESKRIFSNTDIKGGVAISYRATNKNFGIIDTFTPYMLLNEIFKKISNMPNFKSIETIMSGRDLFHYSKTCFDAFPNMKSRNNNNNVVNSNAFEKFPEVFQKEKKQITDIKVTGRIKSVRETRYIKKEYLDNNQFLGKHKVIIAQANGSGALGETLSPPLLGEPEEGFTDTFICIGMFDSQVESKNCLKYIKTKFARALLAVLKVTQSMTKDKWHFVPIQDFTNTSDIDWSVPVKAIDQQLYKKYGLSQEEIDFIETNVKEME